MSEPDDFDAGTDDAPRATDSRAVWASRSRQRQADERQADERAEWSKDVREVVSALIMSPRAFVRKDGIPMTLNEYVSDAIIIADNIAKSRAARYAPKPAAEKPQEPKK